MGANIGGPLSKQEILKRLESRNINKRIFIVPIIDKEGQVENGSMDLRLGNEFLLTRRAGFSLLDPLETAPKLLENIRKYQEKIFIKVGEKLILHPGQLALGATLEYVRLPIDLISYVIGRSSWGRLGLVIATATLVHPNFRGVITLELTNLGEVPIALYPGSRIAQLVFHKLIIEKDSSAMISPHLQRYLLSTGPVFSRIFEDEDWKWLRKIKSSH